MNIPCLSAAVPPDRNDKQPLISVWIISPALRSTRRRRREAKTLINRRAELISKIEKPAALENFPDILTLSDGIMVARGDCRNTANMYRAFSGIRQSNQADKFVGGHAAIQWSYRDPRQTNDVSAAISQGLTLYYPGNRYRAQSAEAVRMMRRICESTRASWIIPPSSCTPFSSMPQQRGQHTRPASN